MSTHDRVQCLHPDAAKTAPRIDAHKYTLVRRAMLDAVPADLDGIPFTALSGEVERRLSAQELADLGSVGWYTTVVKLDLEARGVIERVPGAKPQRVRRPTVSPEHD